ncbi:MAG: bifunctional metallophosphatase/5'-nucleotidase [Bacteroidetes bacterium]|nr:bifunctional metallophosphatase/5'-nucleotidase [Bacteroidota bacterium]
MRWFLSLPLVVILSGCATVSPTVELSVPVVPPDPTVSFTILQLNDVYEITPVAGGREGGLARVATIRKQLLAENPNTYTVIAGDFFGPSALGTARVDGERLRGKQMVAVLNALGLDLATFGNHEFDLDEGDFMMRMKETNFDWVSTNVTDASGTMFMKTEPHRIVTFTDDEGDTVNVAFVGVTLDSNPKDYVRYSNPIRELYDEVEYLSDRADVIVALTHLALEDDIRVAVEIPGIDLILGGHEHENVEVYRGSDFTPIFKADANARSVYIHRITFDPRTGDVSMNSELMPVNGAIPDDPEVAAVVQEWVDIAFSGFIEQGFDPNAVVTTTTEALDGREATIRNRETNLGSLIAESFLREDGSADLAVFNGGSVRIDDVLPAGDVSQYDIIRVMPFGGNVLAVGIKGSVLAQALTQGLANRGSGGFLQTANVSRDGETWMIGGEALDPDRTYRMATNDFLVSGRETGLDFFNVEENPDMELLATHRDVRMACIDELQRRFGRP